MSYDPDPRRKRKRKGHRKGVEPAGLKRWRLSRKHRKSYDPPRKKSRDPTHSWSQRARSARRRSYGFGGAVGRGPLGKVEGIAAKWGAVIGFLVGFVLPDYQSFEDAKKLYPYLQNQNILQYMVDGAKASVRALTGKDPYFPGTTDYLRYKFMDTEKSHWAMPFWISLIAFIVSRLNIVPQRINRILRPVSTGALAATTIGALFQYGSHPGSNNANTMTRGQDGTYQLPLQTASYYS